MLSILEALALGSLALFGYILTRRPRGTTSQQEGCQDPPKRHTKDPVLGLGYRLQDLQSATHATALTDGRALHQQYGLTYYESSLFGNTIKTADAANLQSIFGLKAKEWGVKPFRFEGFRPFCGEGLLSTDGHAWERSRALLQPSFKKSNISDLTTFEESLQKLLEQLPKDGSTVDMSVLLSTLFMDNSTQFVLGEPLGLLDKLDSRHLPVSGEKFLEAFRRSLLGCGLSMMLGPLRYLIPRSMTTKQYQIVHQFFDHYVDKAVQLADSKQLDPLDGRQSVLNSTVQQTVNKMEVRSQTMQAMLAAQDTLPTLICNTLFCLSRNPTIWDRLRAEVASIGDTNLTIEDTRKLPLLRNVLSETLRLYPVFPILARDALQDTILPSGGGPQKDKPIFVPAGSRIIADFWTLHREEEVFGPNVDSFEPDRWNFTHPEPWQYMAFGRGMRACLGQYKALGEASCVIIRLVQSFRSIESRDTEAWAGVLQLVARNVHGCKIGLIPI